MLRAKERKLVSNHLCILLITSRHSIVPSRMTNCNIVSMSQLPIKPAPRLDVQSERGFSPLICTNHNPIRTSIIRCGAHRHWPEFRLTAPLLDVNLSFFLCCLYYKGLTHSFPPFPRPSQPGDLVRSVASCCVCWHDVAGGLCCMSEYRSLAANGNQSLVVV